VSNLPFGFRFAEAGSAPRQRQFPWQSFATSRDLLRAVFQKTISSYLRMENAGAFHESWAAAPEP